MVVPTRVGQVYVYDAVRPDRDEYDVPPRHQTPGQHDVYDVPPARQQYSTQVGHARSTEILHQCCFSHFYTCFFNKKRRC